MKIAINLSDEKYKTILDGNYCGVSDEELYCAIKNGITLPEGHGRLIDVNDLLNRIGLEDNDTNREDNVGEIITLEDFDFTPTIIEADKGGEQG